MTKSPHLTFKKKQYQVVVIKEPVTMKTMPVRLDNNRLEYMIILVSSFVSNQSTKKLNLRKRKRENEGILEQELKKRKDTHGLEQWSDFNGTCSSAEL